MKYTRASFEPGYVILVPLDLKCPGILQWLHNFCRFGVDGSMESLDDGRFLLVLVLVEVDEVDRFWAPDGWLVEEVEVFFFSAGLGIWGLGHVRSAAKLEPQNYRICSYKYHWRWALIPGGMISSGIWSDGTLNLNGWMAFSGELACSLT